MDMRTTRNALYAGMVDGVDGFRYAKWGLTELSKRAEATAWLKSHLPVLIARMRWPLLVYSEKLEIKHLPALMAGAETAKEADGLGRLSLRTVEKVGGRDVVMEIAYRNVQRVVEGSFEKAEFVRDLAPHTLYKEQLRGAGFLFDLISSPGLVSDTAVLIAGVCLLATVDVSDYLARYKKVDVASIRKAWKETDATPTPACSLFIAGYRAEKVAALFMSSVTGKKMGSAGWTVADVLSLWEVYLAGGSCYRRVSKNQDWWRVYKRKLFGSLFPSYSEEKLDRLWAAARPFVQESAEKFMVDEMRG